MNNNDLNQINEGKLLKPVIWCTEGEDRRNLSSVEGQQSKDQREQLGQPQGGEISERNYPSNTLYTRITTSFHRRELQKKLRQPPSIWTARSPQHRDLSTNHCVTS